ncbi:hypothetical protein FACS1894211_02210 [Clostridia bacterium]|nr:hypothetical protein FACS1894211_02210 [Clostridia bacterium]
MKIKRTVCLFAALVLAAAGLSFISVTPARAASKYKIQGTEPAGGDYIVTDLNIKDLGASGDGSADDTDALETALETARERGGGIVYVPAGKYRLTRTVDIPSGVTLIGQWRAPTAGDYAGQTVLIADLAGGKDDGAAFIGLSECSCLKNINVYYKNQSVDKPIAFPYAIRALSYSVAVVNVTLINAYRGMDFGGVTGTATHIENFYGTVVKQGIYIDVNYEVSDYVNLNFSGSFWKRYDTGLNVESLKAAVKDAEVLRIGKVDDLFLYEVRIDEAYYKNEIIFQLNPAIPQVPKLAYGHVMRLNGASVWVSEPDNSPRLSILDLVPGAGYYSHERSGEQRPASDKLYVVTDYGAQGDYDKKTDRGTDDTDAFIDALAAAGKTGGTVFVPVGKYILTDKLVVPAGVELRGEWDSPMNKSPSEIIVKYGRGIGEAEAGEALITLWGGAGVHGLTFRTPNMKTPDKIGPTDKAEPWAWLIEATGDGPWIEYVTFVNTYNAVHIKGCQNFVVKGVWGSALNRTILIDGGSANGRIEYTMGTFGAWWEDTGRAADQDAFSTYFYENAVVYTFRDCENIAGFAADMFGESVALSFEADQNGKGPRNIRLIRSVADLPGGKACVNFHAGDNIALVGLSTGTIGVLYDAEGFTGKAAIYGHVIWGGTKVKLYPGKDISIYNQSSDVVEILKFDFPFERKTAGGLSGLEKGLIAATAGLFVAAVALLILRLFGFKKKA